MNAPLTPSRRQDLRAKAHPLEPVAMIGNKGLTAEVLAEIERQLAKHELIKIKAASDERDERDAWLAEACRQLGAEPVQHVGKVFVLYRRRPDPPPEVAPTKPVRDPGKPTPQALRQAAVAGKPAGKRPRSGPPPKPGGRTFGGSSFQTRRKTARGR